MALTEFWEVDLSNPSQVWDRLIGHAAENPAETAQQLSVILDGIPAGERTLEIGAGVGRLMKALRRLQVFREVYGCDSSVSMVLVGQRYLDDGQGDQNGLALSDGLHLPYPDTYFDFVYSFTVMQHQRTLAMIHRNLTEARRVLKVGGLCRIQTVKAKPDTCPNDFTSYDGRVMESAGRFADMFTDAGLAVEKVEEGLTHPEHIWVTARRAS